MQGAVWSVVVVERFEFAQGVPEVGLVQDEGAVEQFGSAGADPPFHDRVHPRYADPGLSNRDTAVGQNGIESGGVFAVSVPDQVLHGGAGVLQIHDQVSCHLGGPGCGGVCGCAEDADAAGGVLDDGEDDQPCSGQGAGVEEVGGEEGVGLAAQEGGPGEVVAVGRGLDAVGLEDLPDGGGCDRDGKCGEFAVDSAVAPAGVVACQAQDEGADAADGGWSAGLSGTKCSGVSAAQQVAVPAQDGCTDPKSSAGE